MYPPWPRCANALSSAVPTKGFLIPTEQLRIPGIPAVLWRIPRISAVEDPGDSCCATALHGAASWEAGLTVPRVTEQWQSGAPAHLPEQQPQPVCA